MAALAGEQKMRCQVKEIVQERERVVSHLREAGWNIQDSGGNFIWFPGKVGEKILAAALAQGIQTRGFPEGVRVTIGLRQENDQFLAAISQIEPG